MRLLVASISFMLVVECFLKAGVLAMTGYQRHARRHNNVEVSMRGLMAIWLTVIAGAALVNPAIAVVSQEDACVSRIAQILGVPANVIRPMKVDAEHQRPGEITLSTPSGPATCWTDGGDARPEQQLPQAARSADDEGSQTRACATEVAQNLGVPANALRSVLIARTRAGALRIDLDTPFGIATCRIDETNAIQQVQLPGQH